MNSASGSSSLDSNQLLKLLATRKSFRRFLEEPLDDVLVDQIISDSLNAPTACNHQMHHFVVVSAIEVKRKLQEISGSNDHFLSASHLVVLCFQKGWNHNKFAVVQSTAALAYHLCLSAHLRGVGSVWNAGIGNTRKVRQILDIPDAFEVIGVICLGWPDESLENRKPPRRGIEVVRSYDRFHRPEDHLFPLRSAAEYPYWKMKNNDNPFAVHDPREWTLGQIREWRGHAVFAKSPTPGIFVSRRLKTEMPHELASIGEIELGDRILEVMPFAGSYTVMLHNMRPSETEMHIADLSKHNLDFTCERIHNECGPFIKMYPSVMEDLRLPYADATFDAVFMPQILECLPDPWPLLEEALRVLRPGGRLGVSLRNRHSWFGFYFHRSVGRGQVTNFGPYLPVVVSKWRRVFLKSARVESEWGVSPFPSRIGQRVDGIMARFCRLWVVQLRKLD